jgi:hypothetical protein
MHVHCLYSPASCCRRARADLLVALVKDSLSKMIRTIFSTILAPEATSTSADSHAAPLDAQPLDDSTSALIPSMPQEEQPAAFRSARHNGHNGQNGHGGAAAHARSAGDGRGNGVASSASSSTNRGSSGGSGGGKGRRHRVRGYGVQCADSILQFLIKLVEARSVSLPALLASSSLLALPSAAHVRLRACR